MRFALFAAAALASAASPLCAKPVEYRMVTEGVDIGRYVVDREGQTVSID